MKTSGYLFQSCFGSYIEMFIQEKRSAGFLYESEEWKLKHFDAYCIRESVTDPVLTKDLIYGFGALRDDEALVTCSGRISVLRQFAFFLTTLGIEAYIPSRFFKAGKTVAHVLSDEEIKELFEEIDRYIPNTNGLVFHRLAAEYKVIFRLIYCCGLRISEARKLKWDDVDLSNGSIRILHSKGRKDRLVYLAKDLEELIRSYASVLREVYRCDSVWVFPAREPENCLSNVTIDKMFRRCWRLTSYYGKCDRDPTVHSLRHTFVVKRMNLWMEDDVPLKEMMPYLSRYLGHMSPDDTFYYYHHVDSAFRIIRKKDTTASKVIPEVSYE